MIGWGEKQNLFSDWKRCRCFDCNCPVVCSEVQKRRVYAFRDNNKGTLLQAQREDNDMSPLCTHIRESVGTGPIPDCRNDPTLSSSCMFRDTAVFVPLVLIISLRLQASSYPDKSLLLTLRADTDLAPSDLEGAGRVQTNQACEERSKTCSERCVN